MRIILTFLLLSILTLASSQEKKNVVASTSIFADMAENIGGDKINISSVVSIGADPHTYEPIPSDAQLIKNADLILVNGLTLEGWINKLIENAGGDALVTTITKGVDAIQSARYHNAYDPHAWMTAYNGLIYIENIYDSLVEIDPENKEYYTKNYDLYRARLLELDHYIQTEINKIPEKRRLLVTSHDAFVYFGKRYGIKLSAINGISTEAQIQTSDIIRVNKNIKESQVPAIFIESTISPKVIQQIAKDNNVSIGGELYADSIGEKGSDGDSYTKMLVHNTDVIVAALAGSEFTETKIDHDDTTFNYWIYIGLGVAMILGLFLVIAKLN